MPIEVTLHLIGVWFCVGLFSGAGWAFGTWGVAKLTSWRRAA